LTTQPADAIASTVDPTKATTREVIGNRRRPPDLVAARRQRQVRDETLSTVQRDGTLTGVAPGA